MLKTIIAGIPLDCCIYNASGPRTGTIEVLSKVGESKAGAILSKSATLSKQDGNPLPRIINKISLGDSNEGAINSEGLPNFGIDYYISDAAVEALTKFSKPYILSLSGLSLEDNMEMLSRAFTRKQISAIELNLACPNIPGKPTIAYDFEQMESVLRTVTQHPLFGEIPLGVKLAPYFDMSHFDKAADILAKYPVKFIVTINTIGNALFVDLENECACISPKGGFGGLSGGYVKPTALANVRMMSLKLAEKGRSDIDVIGVGGVFTGTDAFELILCGAKAVQVGTCHWTEGAACFDRIATELETIMRRKGYSSIEEFRGKLKPYIKHKSKFTSSSASQTQGTTVSTTKAPQDFLYVSIIVVLMAVIGTLLFPVNR